jgi:hypothetical protein
MRGEQREEYCVYLYCNIYPDITMYPEKANVEEEPG